MTSLFGKALLITNNHKLISSVQEKTKLESEFEILNFKSLHEASTILKNLKYGVGLICLSSKLGLTSREFSYHYQD